MGDNTLDGTDMLVVRVGVILEKTFDRLDGAPSYNDNLAIRSAINEAAVAGYQVGVAELAHVVEQAGGTVEVNYVAEHPNFDSYAAEMEDD